MKIIGKRKLIEFNMPPARVPNITVSIGLECEEITKTKLQFRSGTRKYIII